MLTDLKKSALKEVERRKKWKNPHAKKYWQGMAQAYANAACLSYGHELATKNESKKGWEEISSIG